MPMSEPPRWFALEVYTCPSCKEDYQRIEFDNRQSVCPRCLNKESEEE